VPPVHEQARAFRRDLDELVKRHLHAAGPERRDALAQGVAIHLRAVARSLDGPTEKIHYKVPKHP
jgi:hypothetical protein